jgi:hypothetical protein
MVVFTQFAILRVVSTPNSARVTYATSSLPDDLTNRLLDAHNHHYGSGMNTPTTTTAAASTGSTSGAAAPGSVGSHPLVSSATAALSTLVSASLSSPPRGGAASHTSFVQLTHSLKAPGFNP